MLNGSPRAVFAWQMFNPVVQLARIVYWISTSEMCMQYWSSIDLTMIGVRPPFFLHGNKRNGTWARALPNARTVAGGTRPQPLPHAA